MRSHLKKGFTDHNADSLLLICILCALCWMFARIMLNACQYWKNYNDLASFGIMGVQLRASLKPLEHHSTMVLRCLWVSSFNRDPIMPRGIFPI